MRLRHGFVMGMPMMFIMHMSMFVFEQFMQMLMLGSLGEVQPKPKAQSPKPIRAAATVSFIVKGSSNKPIATTALRNSHLAPHHPFG
jgi:hypothetical protein